MSQISEFKGPVLSKSGKKWVIIVSVLGLLITGSGIIYGLRLNRDQVSLKQETSLVKPSPRVEVVTALGRLEPKGEVIKLAASPNLGGAKISQLLVEEGDKLKEGQIVAILANMKLKKAAVTLAEKDVQVAQANLNIIKAGAKQGEIEAQEANIQSLQGELDGEIASYQEKIAGLEAELNGEKVEQNATIQRLQAELADAQRDWQRYQTLAQEGVVSDVDLEQKYLKLETAKERVKEAQAKLSKTIEILNKSIQEETANLQKQIDTLEKQIQEANATLESIKEVRPVDIQKAQAELEKAQASLKEAQEDLELAYVRSPIAGQVIKIHTRPGEREDEQNKIIEIGRTEQMIAIAEVYESDINKIKLGQEAIITSENNTFSQELTGKVEQIGLEIGKKDVLDTDPAADVDVRVIEVKIHLDPESSSQVTGLTNAKVIVKIFT
jgi:HlyD family secretion protein